MLLEHERYYDLGMDAQVTVCRMLMKHEGDYGFHLHHEQAIAIHGHRRTHWGTVIKLYLCVCVRVRTLGSRSRSVGLIQGDNGPLCTD